MKYLIEVVCRDYQFDVEGFTVQEGFIVFRDSESLEVVAASSGWANNDELFVYRMKGGEWKGNWEKQVFDDYEDEGIENDLPIDRAIKISESVSEARDVYEHVLVNLGDFSKY